MKQIILSILLFAMSTPAFAGGGSYVSQSVNLILLLVIFFLIGKKNLPILFNNRAQDIQYNIEKGQKQLDEAKQRNEELKQQLNNLSVQIDAIQDQAKLDVEAMERKMAQQLSDEKRRIQESSKRSIQEELNRAKQELKRESVEISVELAAELLKENINDDDHQRLSQTFVQAVAKGGTHG
jgi:F-type H+-transporting ATPase subunit b